MHRVQCHVEPPLPTPRLFPGSAPARCQRNVGEKPVVIRRDTTPLRPPGVAAIHHNPSAEAQTVLV